MSTGNLASAYSKMSPSTFGVPGMSFNTYDKRKGEQIPIQNW